MATAALPDKISDNFLQCTICCYTFKKPKVLIPCLHTFCEHCLAEWVQRNKADTFPCPICRQEVPLPPNGVEGLKDNAFIAGLAEAVTEHHNVSHGEEGISCTSCEEGKPATSRCSECAEFLCESCESAHRVVKATRGHTLFTFEELKTGKYDHVFKANKAPFCPKHTGEILKLFCRSCETPICNECALFGHRDSQHKLIQMAEMAAEKRKLIQDLTPQCQARMQYFRQTEEVQNCLKANLQLNAEGARQNVRKTVQALIEVVQEEGERLLTCIDTEEASRKKQIEAEIEGAQISLASAKSTCEFAETLAREGGDYEVVSFSQETSRRLNELTKPPAETVDFELANMTVDYSALKLKLTTNSPSTAKYSLPKSAENGLRSLLKGVPKSTPTVGKKGPLKQMKQNPAVSSSMQEMIERWNKHIKSVSREEPPGVKVQKATISTEMKKEMRKGDTWLLVDAKWYKQWKKYVGYDSWNMYGMGDQATHPGPIDNSALFKDPQHPNGACLKRHLIDEMDYWNIPEEAFCKLVSWYGIEDSHVIPRKVVEHGLFVKNCIVEVYLRELKLCNYSNMEHVITQEFSKDNTIGYIEESTRSLFNIPTDRRVRVWRKYMSNTYELLDKPSETVEDSGLYQGQVIVIEEQNSDGSWPRGLTTTKPKTP